MSAILSCQDQYFVGGQGYDCPYSVSTSAANVDVSKETLVSFWAAGLLDNRACQHEQHSQQRYYELDSGIRDDFVWTDHLSPQLQRNQQLQDTLLEKEEELARLHDENNKLKEYLNSTFVKGLEEKAKILLHNGLGVDSRPRNKRRRVLGDEGVHASTASQLLPGSSLKKACRNLSLEFCTAEELAHTPPVDSWVLQTLGLKDVDTIDHSANYSDLLTSLDDHNALHADPGVGVEYTGSPCSLDTRYLSPLPSSSPQAQSTPLPSSATPSPFKSPYSVEVSRNKTEVAFTMSLNPHRNVKTHSFDQGQAFVCRDDQAGWKFTWVPKQSE
ncbi:geminin coiled-coil domain-containing protein 1-like [Acipenser oxyrinchus oxyrinchus]|uniref:Geminin coiled-coil domain-containing protein 1-like n=1 Tax=Acipenser oxyrinchus oxyrinchus TaxID=40147 RepID=A0AAD8G287_ACIOX|nr:geminin coiled-coil domain-containing protein 1-like [Acipenser oxyrinchus oxyrinchus]